MADIDLIHLNFNPQTLFAMPVGRHVLVPPASRGCRCLIQKERRFRGCLLYCA